MTDRDLRELERLVDIRDPVADEQLLGQRARAGLHDPALVALLAFAGWPAARAVQGPETFGELILELSDGTHGGLDARLDARLDPRAWAYFLVGFAARVTPTRSGECECVQDCGCEDGVLVGAHPVNAHHGEPCGWCGGSGDPLAFWRRRWIPAGVAVAAARSTLDDWENENPDRMARPAMDRAKVFMDFPCETHRRICAVDLERLREDGVATEFVGQPFTPALDLICYGVDYASSLGVCLEAATSLVGIEAPRTAALAWLLEPAGLRRKALLG